MFVNITPLAPNKQSRKIKPIMHLPHISFSRGRNKLNIFLFEEDWQSAITEIECHPHEAKVWSARPGFFDGEHESNVLPIHVACSLHAPLDVIKAIVRAYPECVGIAETSFKRLPLHICCQFAAPNDVVQYLADKHVSGTSEPDMLGRLAVHYACSNGAPLDVVDVLLKANPSSCLYADYNAWLPLHVAVHFGAKTDVVRELIRSCPASVHMKTKKGSTALTLAKKVSTKNKEEVVALLEGAVPGEMKSPEPERKIRQMKFSQAA